MTSDPVSEKPRLQQLQSKKKPHRACFLCKRQHRCQNLSCSWALASEPTMPNQFHILWRASIVPEHPQYLGTSKLTETDLTHLFYRAIPHSQQSRTVSHRCSILHANGNGWPLCCVLRWKKINQLCHTSFHICYEVRLCTQELFKTHSSRPHSKVASAQEIFSKFLLPAHNSVSCYPVKILPDIFCWTQSYLKNFKHFLKKQKAKPGRDTVVLHRMVVLLYTGAYAATEELGQPKLQN